MSSTNTGEGLQVAQEFCQKWILPFLETEFPDLHDRSACVLFGGSQSLGNDDALSRDHGWGPAFELFLTNADTRQYGKLLQRALSEAAPRNWQDAEWRELRPSSCYAAIGIIGYTRNRKEVRHDVLIATGFILGLSH